MLVGDLIVSTRTLGPDPCQVFPVPNLAGLVTNTPSANPLPAGTYYVVGTVFTPFGESGPSLEVSVSQSGSQAIVLNANQAGASVSKFRFYYGTISGGESNYIDATPAQIPLTLNALNGSGSAALNGIPPVLNRAYLPDTDGGFASAVTLYQWLNEALRAASRVAGGIQDATGVSSVSGQRRYVLNGQWLKIDHAFYDGWELDQGTKADVFYNRNLTANISISLMVDAQSDTTRCELYWTPSRTSGSTTTNGTLNQTDINVPINATVIGTNGWLLADGYALVGSEIVSYSAITSSQLQNCIRGWGGTLAPSSLASGAAVSELNIMLFGYRMPYVYSVGQAALTLAVPPGWEPFLKDYMLGLFRLAEQETQEGQSLMKKATDSFEQWVKSNKPVAGPRQCRIWDDRGIRGIIPGGISGGIIIP